MIRGLLNLLGSLNPNNVCSKILCLELNGNFKNCFGLLLVESGHNLDPIPPDKIMGVILFTVRYYFFLDHSLSFL